MKAVRARLAPSRDDSGMTLVEVMAAMMIFALISTGIIYTMLQVLSVTRDSRARVVAANLASEEVDLARDTEDLFGLLDEDREVVLNNDVYTVHRRTQWVSDPGADFTCGGTSGGTGGALRYKRVNVTVTWENMRGTTPVRADTVIDPKQRINDPTKGTILVSVLNAAGTGVGGVGVSASPNPGTAIASTDAQGCTYILKANPNSYTVTVNRSGYLSGDQQPTASAPVTVQAGESASVGFLYERAATYRARLAVDHVTNPGETIRVSNQMPVTFRNSYGDFVRPSTGTAATQNFPLHPYPAGYDAFGGACTVADPATWEDETVGGVDLVAPEPRTAAGLPGETIDIEVPMGVVRIAGGGSGSHLRAVSQDGACGGQELRFGSVLSGSPTTIALPYGSWRLFRGSSAGGSNTPIGAGSLSVPDPAVPERTTIASDGTVTFDPRVEAAEEPAP